MNLLLFQIYTLDLPPWLNSVTLKRKKQAISPDVFDFQQLKRSKSKAAKKAKTVSRVVVDSNKMKYAKIAKPLADKSPEEMQVSDYKFTRVDLGKQTHAGMMQDAQNSITVITHSYNELLAKKEKLKEENSQLISVIQKIANYSKQVNPLTSFTSKESVKQLEKIAQKAKAVDPWVTQLIDQSIPVIEKTLQVLNNVRIAKIKLNQTLEAFKQNLDSLEKDLKIWHEIDQIKLQILCSNSILPSREKYIEFEELMTNKSLVIQDLIKDIQATLEMSDEVQQDILSSFEKIPCRILNHEGELLEADMVTTKMTANLRQELESEHFTMDSIHKLVNHRMILDKMQTVYEEHRLATIRYFDVILKTVAVAKNTLGPDPNELQMIISKFLSFKDRNETN